MHEPRWRPVVPLFAANVVFAAGLWGHAFLYNFYLQELGHGEGVLGLAAAALTAGGLIALVPAGVLVDRRGARGAYAAAAGLGGLGLFAGAFVESAAGVYLAAAVAGMGAATWRVAMGPAFMAAARDEVRARAFSWNVALLLASGAAWTAAAGWASDWIAASHPAGQIGGLRWTLAVSAVLTTLAALLFPRQAPHSDVGPATSSPARRTGLRGLALPPRLLALVAIVFLWMLAGGLVLPFFNLYFQRSHAMAVGDIGTLFGAVQLLTAAVLFGAGELSARAGPRPALALWSFALAPCLGLLALGGPLALAIGLYAVIGFVPPATNPLIDQILLEEAAPETLGVVSSWRNGATEASGFVGAAAAGFLLEGAGFPALFATAGATAALGAVALLWWSRGTDVRPAPRSR